MTDNALESLFNELVRTRPPGYDENLDYRIMPGTFHWSFPPEAVWELFVKFYRHLEVKENESSKACCTS